MKNKPLTKKSITTSRGRYFIAFIVSILLLSCYHIVFAGSGEDILAGTTSAAVKTVNGSVKTYLYIAEFVGAAYAFIRTKNVMLLGGIAVLAFYLNVMLGKFITG